MRQINNPLERQDEMNFDFDLSNEIDPVDLFNLIEDRKSDSEVPTYDRRPDTHFFWDEEIEITAGNADGRTDSDPMWVTVTDDGVYVDELIQVAREWAECDPDATEIWLSGELRCKLPPEDFDDDEPTGIWWSIELKI